MLNEVAEGVLVHASEWVHTNTVVVQGRDGALLVDPGIYDHELTCLANDVADAGQVVVAGFSTHPHCDHLLWHPSLGEARRHATARCAETAERRLSGGVEAVAKAAGIPEQVSLDLLGRVVGLPAGAVEVPWHGPGVRIVEHAAHAAGHAALVVEEHGVLVAGDMLSDVLVPMLDPTAEDPIEDYLAALSLLEVEVGDAGVVVPGHGSAADRTQALARIELDRAYVLALRDGREPDDPRIGPSAEPAWEWVRDVHAGQVQRLAEKREPDAASG